MSKQIRLRKTENGEYEKSIVTKETSEPLSKEDACMGFIYDCEYFVNKACSKIQADPNSLIYTKNSRGKYGCPENRWWAAHETSQEIKAIQSRYQNDSGDKPLDIPDFMTLIIRGLPPVRKQKDNNEDTKKPIPFAKKYKSVYRTGYK